MQIKEKHTRKHNKRNRKRHTYIRDKRKESGIIAHSVWRYGKVLYACPYINEGYFVLNRVFKRLMRISLFKASQQHKYLFFLIYNSSTFHSRNKVIFTSSHTTLFASTMSSVKRGRVSGTQNFSREDIDELLYHLEEEPPTNQSGWIRIRDRYATYATMNERRVRDITSLRSKYNHLANKTNPTGDPNCPHEVRRAKAIQQQIVGRWNSQSPARVLGKFSEDAYSETPSEAPPEVCSEASECSQIVSASDQERASSLVATTPTQVSSHLEPERLHVSSSTTTSVSPSHDPRPARLPASRKRPSSLLSEELTSAIASSFSPESRANRESREVGMFNASMLLRQLEMAERRADRADKRADRAEEKADREREEFKRDLREKDRELISLRSEVGELRTKLHVLEYMNKSVDPARK